MPRQQRLRNEPDGRDDRPGLGGAARAALVKDSLPHGQFKQWVADNCEFGYDSANDYINSAKRAAKNGAAPSLTDTGATPDQEPSPTTIKAAAAGAKPHGITDQTSSP